jgi:hypothetical protein
MSSPRTLLHPSQRVAQLDHNIDIMINLRRVLVLNIILLLNSLHASASLHPLLCTERYLTALLHRPECSSEDLSTDHQVSSHRPPSSQEDHHLLRPRLRPTVPEYEHQGERGSPRPAAPLFFRARHPDCHQIPICEVQPDGKLQARSPGVHSPQPVRPALLPGSARGRIVHLPRRERGTYSTAHGVKKRDVCLGFHQTPRTRQGQVRNSLAINVVLS